MVSCSMGWRQTSEHLKVSSSNSYILVSVLSGALCYDILHQSEYTLTSDGPLKRVRTFVFDQPMNTQSFSSIMADCGTVEGLTAEGSLRH